MVLISAAIIPHAGIQYAGECRKSVFTRIPNPNKIKYIVYIATFHNLSNQSEEDNKIKCLYIDSEFPIHLFESFLKNDFNSNEHSFKWVQSELKNYFSNALTLVIAPTNSKFTGITSIVSFLLNSMENILLLATTDLTHYGSRFHNQELIDPTKKIIDEQDFIYELIHLKYPNSLDNRVCGPFAIQFFISILQLSNLQWKGKVYDYYDSNQFEHYTNRYLIKQKDKINEFVSYVSILYLPKINFCQGITLFDKNFCFGIILSILYNQLLQQNNDNLIIFPKWSPWNCFSNGAFISTSLNGTINSCVGRFENKNKTSANIIQATKDLINDSINRWNNSITLENLFQLQIQIEILEKKEKWILIKPNDFIEKYNVKYGTYLVLPNGLSATYLPDVYQEHFFNNKLNYIQSLTQKAGSLNKNEWKNSKIYFYTTKVLKMQ